MKITIDNKILDKYNISKEQFFFMLSTVYKTNNEEINSLLNKHFYITQNYDKGIPLGTYSLTSKGAAIINKIILESDNISTESKNRLDTLVKTLQSMFPTGKKPDTNTYWRGNSTEIKDRLQIFFKKFGDFPDEVIINATKKYIESFGYDTKLMKTLKYFISKRKEDGNTEYDLLTFIENSEEGNEEYTTLKTTELI